VNTQQNEQGSKAHTVKILLKLT